METVLSPLPTSVASFSNMIVISNSQKSITLKFQGEDILERALQQYIQNVKTRKSAMKAASHILYLASKTQFKKEGEPKWLPLKPSTLKTRKKRGYKPGPILQRSKTLIRSILKAWDNNSASIYTTTSYAPFHQFGAKKSTRKSSTLAKIRKILSSHRSLPPRPFFNLTPTDVQKLIKTFVDHLTKKK
jgi:phage virion morphogenesis protein